MPTLHIAGTPEQMGAFTYLWLTFVTGFDPGEHCQRCLHGQVRTRMNTPDNLNRIICLTPREPYDYIYVCGEPSGVKDCGIRLAPRPRAGAEATLTAFNGMVLTLSDMERVCIPPLPRLLNSLPECFTTYMNYRFGVAHYPQAVVRGA